MPALNFKSCFAPAVEAARKRCTIRLPRQRPIRVGDRLFLYTDQRSRNSRKLGEAVCRSVETICLWIGCKNSEHLPGGGSPCVGLLLNGRHLSREEWQQLAVDDGFEGIFDFVRFFQRTYGLPFLGVLIRW